MDWRSFFSWPAARKTPPSVEGEIAPSAGNGGGEAIYAHVPEAQISSSKQHRYLFDEGVAHWNHRRGNEDFKASFAGVNFVKEAPKSRLWGRPLDIIGEERVVLTGAHLEHADLQGCTLTRADLRDARLRGADLRRANLAAALLNGADLTGCDLRGANLDGAQLARTKLQHANLSGASLKNTNFAWADMSHAMVGARNLQEANLFGTVRNSVRAPVEAHPQAEAAR